MAGLEPVGVAVAPHVSGQWGWVVRAPGRSPWRGREAHVAGRGELAQVLIDWVSSRLAPQMVVSAVAGLSKQEQDTCGLAAGEDDRVVARVRAQATQLAEQALADLHTKAHFTTTEVGLIDDPELGDEGEPREIAAVGVCDDDGADWAWVSGAGWHAHGNVEADDARAVATVAITHAIAAAPRGGPVWVHGEDDEAIQVAGELLSGAAPSAVVERHPWLEHELATRLTAACEGRQVHLAWVETDSTPELVAAMDLCAAATPADHDESAITDGAQAALGRAEPAPESLAPAQWALADSHQRQGLAGAQGRVALREHQQRAAHALVEAWRHHDRAQITAPPGSGKTLTYIAALQQRGREQMVERVLVVVPNLDLVAQFASTWMSQLGHVLAQVVGVCSKQEAMDHVAEEALARLSSLQASVVCAPEELAGLAMRPGPSVVVATYQSLHLITRAHEHHHAPTWDALIVDEAHRSVGALTRAWTVVHDDARLPARVRAYGTATPERVHARDGTPVASMDDEKTFGEVAHRLSFSAAVAAKILCDYELLGVVVGHEAIAASISGRDPLRVGDRTVSSDVLAAQIALLRAIGTHELTSVICFAPDVAWARTFTETLQAAATLLDDQDQARVRGLRACHINGASSTTQRHAARELLSSPGIAVVTVVRCWGEGIDVPAVDAVMLCGVHRSPTRIIQAIGRALRPGDNPEAIARILVPLYAPPGIDPSDLLDEPGFATFSRVVSAMRTEDDRLEEVLAKEVTFGRRPGEPGEHGGSGPRVSITEAHPIHPEFARVITTATLTTHTDTWWRNYARYEQAILTHGSVPAQATTETGASLQRWGSHQRSQRDQLKAHKAAAIDRLEYLRTTLRGTFWPRLTAAVLDYQRNHDDLLPPRTHPAWALLHTARQYEKQGRLHKEQVAWLNERNMVWDLDHARRSEKLIEIGQFIATHGLPPERGISQAETTLAGYLDAIYDAERQNTLHPEHRELCLRWRIPLAPLGQGLREDGYDRTPPAELPASKDEVVAWVITALERGANNTSLKRWLGLSLASIGDRLRAAGHPPVGELRMRIIAEAVRNGATLDDITATFPLRRKRALRAVQAATERARPHPTPHQ